MESSTKRTVLVIAVLFVACILCACGSGGYNTSSLNEVNVLPDMEKGGSEDPEENKKYVERINIEEDSKLTEDQEKEEDTIIMKQNAPPEYDDSTEADEQLIEKTHDILDGYINYDREIVISPGNQAK